MNLSKTRLHKCVWSDPTLRKNYTRPEIMRNIEQYGALIGDRLSKNRLEWVFPGQIVTTPDWPLRTLAPIHEIRVLAQTDEYIALFKPFGVPVQPGAGHTEDTVVHWLVAHYTEQKRLMDTAPPDSNMRTVAGLVHRLDKNTQGILLVARTAAMHQALQDEFRNRRVTKKYLAVVQGIVTSQYDIDGWQCRDKTNPMKQRFFATEIEAKHYDSEARVAHSIITPRTICPDLDQTLIEVEIKTGRMHQIRLACEYLGFPLVAEHLYNKVNAMAVDGTSQPTTHTLPAPAFATLKTQIFGNHEFCLLANEIEIAAFGVAITCVDAPGEEGA